MKKAVNAFSILFAMLAVLAFASPVLACGGSKSKSKTTASKSEESTETAKKSDDGAEEKSEDETNTEEPTKS